MSQAPYPTSNLILDILRFIKKNGPYSHIDFKPILTQLKPIFFSESWVADIRIGSAAKLHKYKKAIKNFNIFICSILITCKIYNYNTYAINFQYFTNTYMYDFCFKCYRYSQ